MPLPPKWGVRIRHDCDRHGAPSVIELRAYRDYLRSEYLSGDYWSYSMMRAYCQALDDLATVEWVLACRSWRWCRAPRERELLHWQMAQLNAALDFRYVREGTRGPGRGLALRIHGVLA